MTIRLPLHDLHARLGAGFGAADGHPVVLHYGDADAEHAAIRRQAGLHDRSPRGVVAATGRERAAFLQGMLSNDVKSLAPGQSCPAAFLDAHGKIVALMRVHCLADRLLLEMDHHLVAPTLAALDRFLISERVEFEDASAEHGVATLAGPAARAALEQVAGGALPDLRPGDHAAVTVDGTPVRAVRSEDTGEEGYDLWTAPEGLAPLWERLVAAKVQPVGSEAWDVVRVEAGVVRHGVDVDAGTLLLEAPLEGFYSLSKGCYIGQEVVARITYRGHVNRRVVGFRLAGSRVPARGATVTAEGREVGRITSPVRSPALGVVALGTIRRESAEPRTPVEVEVAGGAPIPAAVAALPLYRRSGG
jgi:folate-binding protein YgfZ